MSSPRTLSNNGSPIFRSALAFEICANLVGAASFILAPRWTLSLVVLPGVALTPLSVTFFQWLGGVTLALSTPLALAYPNTETGIANRRTAYWTLGAGEAVLLAVMMGQYDANRRIFTNKAVAGTFGMLGATLAWRLYALLVRPNTLMGTVTLKERRQ